MANRRKELDSALLDQLDGDNSSSFRDVDTGRKSFGVANTVMTYGDVPSHPFVDDDFHEPEFSQPTQYPFATPADEAANEDDQEQQHKASPTLELDNADIQPPPAKRQKLSPEPSSSAAQAAPKTTTAPSLDSDLVDSSDDDSLPPVTQRPTQPPKKTASDSEESDNEKMSVHNSSEAPDYTTTVLDAEAIESTLQVSSEKPKETWKQKTSAPPPARTEPTMLDDEIIVPEISSDEEEPAPPARPKPSKSGIELVEDVPEAEPQKPAEKPPKVDAKKRTAEKGEEEERPPLSKFLDRRGNKGHKLEEPEKPKKKEPVKEPVKPKKASVSARSPQKKAQPGEDDDETPVVRKKRDAFAFEVLDDVSDEKNDDIDLDEEHESAPQPKAKAAKASRAKPKKSKGSSPPPKRVPSKKRKRYDDYEDDDESESEMSEEPSEEVIVQPTLPDEEEDNNEELEETDFMNELQAKAALQKQSKPAPKKKVQVASTLFKNMFFVVTGIKDCPEISATELKERIESHGEQRTYKYIMALATCVPCLSYRWVLQCLDSNSIVDPKPHMLNAGVDFNKKAHKQPEWFLDETAVDKMDEWDYGVFYVKRKGQGVPESARIEVVGVPDFKAQWTEIIKAAGAKATKDRLASEGTHTNINFILSDSQPTQHTVDACQKLKVPLCGHEWVIQCLIAHKCIDPFTDPSLTIHTDQE